MRKARIKIDRVVKSCLECPFCYEKWIEVGQDEYKGPTYIVRYICVYPNTPHYPISVEQKPGSIPDWCPFSIEEGKEDAD